MRDDEGVLRTSQCFVYLKLGTDESLVCVAGSMLGVYAD